MTINRALWLAVLAGFAVGAITGGVCTWVGMVDTRTDAQKLTEARRLVAHYRALDRIHDAESLLRQGRVSECRQSENSGE